MLQSLIVIALRIIYTILKTATMDDLGNRLRDMKHLENALSHAAA